MLIWVSIWCHCLSARKTSFSVSCRAHLLAVNLLSLCFSENEFIPPSFLKDSFAGYGILVRQFFFFFPFSNLNMLSTPSYLHCFWREVNHCFIILLYMITVFYYFENLSLVDCSPWGREESDTTDWLHFHFSLSCIGEGNGNPLQCSCLENPRDGGAWRAAIYGVAQSQTWLKRLSSSSNIWIGRLSRADCPSSVGGPHPIPWWPEQNRKSDLPANKREWASVPPAWLRSHLDVALFSAFRLRLKHQPFLGS